MSVKQDYSIVDLCHKIVVTVKDKKGKTNITLLCERELDKKELKLVKEVLTDTIVIQHSRMVRRSIDTLEELGYEVTHNGEAA